MRYFSVNKRVRQFFGFSLCFSRKAVLCSLVLVLIRWFLSGDADPQVGLIT